MACSGLPVQIAAARRYDRRPDPAAIAGALRRGDTVFMPQVHQVLPRVARLMVALRALVLGPFREEYSFLFLVQGRGREGMGLHHDGPVDGFWLQLAGRRTVTTGPRVAPGTPADLDTTPAGRGWAAVDLTPGTLFYLPPWTPHRVVCRARSLALSLTWSPPRPPRATGATAEQIVRARARSLAAWDVAEGRVPAPPRRRRDRLWTQVPAVAGAADGRGGVRLWTCDGVLDVPREARPLVRRLAAMPALPRATVRARPGLAPLLAHGVLGDQDLPLRVVPADPGALDGWRFA